MKPRLYAEPCQHEHLPGPRLPPPRGGHTSRCKWSWMPIDNVLAICTLKLMNNVCFAQAQSYGFQSLSSLSFLARHIEPSLLGLSSASQPHSLCFPTSSPPLTPPQFPVRAAVITKCFYYLLVTRFEGRWNFKFTCQKQPQQDWLSFLQEIPSHLCRHSLKIRLTQLA